MEPPLDTTGVRGNTGSDFVSQGAADTAPPGCGIPLTATAVINITVADPDADGDVKVDPADSASSSTSTLNYTFGGGWLKQPRRWCAPEDSNFQPTDS